MIEVRDLKKSFGSHSILNGVSFRIEKGESVVIIGRSGGGKSVLLKHLIGLLKHDGPPLSTEDLCKPVDYHEDGTESPQRGE